MKFHVFFLWAWLHITLIGVWLDIIGQCSLMLEPNLGIYWFGINNNLWGHNQNMQDTRKTHYQIAWKKVFQERKHFYFKEYSVLDSLDVFRLMKISLYCLFVVARSIAKRWAFHSGLYSKYHLVCLNHIKVSWLAVWVSKVCIALRKPPHWNYIGVYIFWHIWLHIYSKTSCFTENRPKPLCFWTRKWPKTHGRVITK